MIGPLWSQTLPDLLIFGCGYSGTAVARAAHEAGFAVTVTSRDPAAKKLPQGIQLISFEDASGAIAKATHLLATAAHQELRLVHQHGAERCVSRLWTAADQLRRRIRNG